MGEQYEYDTNQKGITMRSRISGIVIFALGMVLCAATASADPVEEVSKKIAAATEKLTSFSAKMKMVTEMKQESFSLSSTNEGTMEMLRKGSDFLLRADNKGVTETNAGGNVTKQNSSVMMVNDGAFVYTVSEASGMKSAQKMKIVKPDADPLKNWKSMGEVKVLPDAAVEGRAVWVIETTPKADSAGQGKTVMSFDKESGQMIKMVASSPDGKPASTITYSDIKVNDKIAPDRFVFQAPPGVEVQDLSK